MFLKVFHNLPKHMYRPFLKDKFKSKDSGRKFTGSCLVNKKDQIVK